MQAVGTVGVPVVTAEGEDVTVIATTVQAVATVGSPVLPKFPATIAAIATVGVLLSFPIFAATVHAYATVGEAIVVEEVPFDVVNNTRGPQPLASRSLTTAPGGSPSSTTPATTSWCWLVDSTSSPR